MTLNHVSESTRRFIKGGPLLDTEAFGGGDLNVIDIIPIPEWLKDAVPKSHGQKILDRILSQKMINAIDLRLIEDFENRAVELFRGSEVAAKGLFDNNAHPGVFFRRLRKIGFLNLRDHLGINNGRCGQVEEAITLQMALLVEFLEA